MGKVMFFPILSMGHLNLGTTLGKLLQAKFNGQHEFVILTDIRFKTKLEVMCPFARLRLYRNPKLPSDFDPTKDQDPTVRLIDDLSKSFDMPIEDRFKRQCMHFTQMANNWKETRSEIESIIADEKPDFIFYDNLFAIPFVMNKSIPWGLLCSANPLFVQYCADDLPPIGSGLTDNESDRTKCVEHRQKHSKQTESFQKLLNDWLTECGIQELLPPSHYLYGSPYLNLYLFPTEVDYFKDADTRLKGKWARVESTILPDPILKQIGEKPQELNLDLNAFPLKDGKRKLIYFSLGSLVSSQADLLQRIIDMLGTIEHNFVVSKGVRGDQLVLPPNCIGANYLPQTKLLPHVQLAIVHGGNNTFTECFHYGVPMIIMPVFGDQPDNACRVQQLGLGRWLNLFTCTRDQLAEAIEQLLQDSAAQDRIRLMSKRIQQDNGWNAACDRLLPFLG